jgi:hypothetical protein
MEPKLTLEINETVALAEKAGIEENELKTLKEGFRAVEAEIINKTYGTGEPLLNADRDYTGVPLEEANIMRSRCDVMKWAYDNTGLEYEPYFVLSFRRPRHGFYTYKNDVLIDNVIVPMTGGLNSNPKDQIYDDMNTMIGLIINHAQGQIDKNKKV